MAWEIRQFATVVDDFTATLARSDRTKIAALTTKLADRGNTMKMPESKPPGGGLFE